MDARLARIDDLESCEAQLRAASRIALDTEFHAERRYFPKLYLVQIHVADADTWLLDPLVPELLDALGPALRAVPWVVHAGSQDIRLLTRALGGVPDVVLDTQLAAGLIEPAYPSPLEDLLDRHLDVRLDKTATLSDWSRRPLSPAQLGYAAADVQSLLALWDHLHEHLVARDRADIARAACDTRRAAALAEPDPERAWRRVSAADVMTSEQRAVLQELGAWRQRTAKLKDQPVRSIASDGVIADLARRRPSTLEGLFTDRRFPKSLAKRHGDDLLDAIRRANTRPEWARPAFVGRHTREASTARALDAFAHALGHEEGWAAPLVLPASELDALALDVPHSRSALAERLETWQDALAGDAVWSFLTGTTTMGIRDGQAAILRNG